MHIDQTNYESFFLSYTDGELSDAERQAVEAYCKGNPDAARELALLQQTVAEPSLTVFDRKESLYREEDDRRVIGWYLWRVAAMFVLLAGGAIIYWTMRHESKAAREPESRAIVNAPEKTEPDAAPAEKQRISPDSRTGKETVSAPGAMAGRAARALQQKEPKGAPEPRSASAAVGRAGKQHSGIVRTGKEKQASASKRNKPDQAAQNGRETSDPPEIASAPARSKQSEVSTVQTASGVTGNVISMSGINGVSAAAAAGPDRPTAQSGVVLTRQPSAAEPAGSSGDDAVSIMHLAKNSSPVKKLLRRLRSGEGDVPGENSGNKKVNISIFQFALGK